MRVCDTDTHGAACLPRRVRSFLARLRTLFAEGWVFGELDVDEGETSTCTHTAIAQAMRFGTLVMGTRIVRLWHAGAKPMAARTLAAMGEVIDAVSERLQAEFPAGRLDMDLECFDLRKWKSMRRDPRAHQGEGARLRQCVCRLAPAWLRIPEDGGRVAP